MSIARPATPEPAVGRSRGSAPASERPSYPKVNSLNLIRLVLASLVIVDHARVVGGFGTDPMVGKISLGAVAVFSFFAVSGFLIAGSGLKSPRRQFLVNRVLRIFPGFWICLIATAFVFAPVAAAGYGSGYSPAAGLNYVIRNLGLLDFQPSIGTTLSTAPDPDMWNASLWTLPIEFLCYVAILVAGMTGLLRRRWPVFVVTALLGLALTPTVSIAHSSGQYQSLTTQVLELLVMFGAGASVRLWRTGTRLNHWPVALTCAVLVAAGFFWFEHPVPLIALPLTYVLLWLGAHLPSPGILRRHDISYGIYIYGMPVQQVLTAQGANGHGELSYVILSFAAVIPLAMVSWLLVERPAMSLKSARWLSRGKSASCPTPASQTHDPQPGHSNASSPTPMNSSGRDGNSVGRQ